MKKIFRTKKQRKQELKEQSVFGYFTMELDKFVFYLGHAEMQVLSVDGELYYDHFYKISETNNKKYPYILHYEVKPLNSAIDMKYMVQLNLTKQELDNLQTQTGTEEARLYHVRDVTVYDYEQAKSYDFFDLPEEEIEKVNINLFAAFSMIANYEYVPSPADGEFGTCYKKIRS